MCYLDLHGSLDKSPHDIKMVRTQGDLHPMRFVLGNINIH